MPFDITKQGGVLPTNFTPNLAGNTGTPTSGTTLGPGLHWNADHTSGVLDTPISGASQPNTTYGYSSVNSSPGTGGMYLGNPSPSGGVGPSFNVGDPGLFSGAVNTQSADYDRIMQGYKDMLGSRGITPNLAKYSTSPEVQGSLSRLANLADTGGYSAQGLQDIRERSISPIRSIYANAQQNLERKKSLQGGYSPSFNATTAKMSRDLADQIGSITTNVNAGIAQNVAQNKLAIAPSFASAAANENNARMQAETHNADVMNAIEQFNMGLKQSSLEGMRGLYSATPGLANLFGSQALQSRNLDQNQQQINMQGQQGLMRLLMSILGES
jgi:hypothetical protein